MKIRWLSTSERDLVRLYDFMVEINPAAAARVVQNLVAATQTLIEFPHIGVRKDDYLPREVRGLLAGDYEIRYEVTMDSIIILRVWHTREDR